MRMHNHLPIGTLLAAMLCAVTAGIARPAACQQNDAEETFVVIRAGHLITLAGEKEESGEIVLVDGKIRLVGKGLEYPKSATVINARREVVMPGLIHPRSRWQLPSYSRSGIHADRSAAKEICLEEIDFEPLLRSGFTAVCFYPAGTGIPGPAVVYRTAGKDDGRELGPAYLRITMSGPRGDKKVLRDAVAKARKEIEKVEKARKEWEEKQKKAKEEAAKKEADEKKPDKKESDKKDQPTPEKKDDGGEGKDDDGGKDNKKDTPEKKEGDKAKPEEKKPETFTPPKIDPAVKPLVDWIRDKKGPPLLFELSQASDLRHLDDVLQQARELPGTLLYLGASYSGDYHHVVEDLGKRKAVVLAAPSVGALPYTVVRYNLPAELALADCTVAVLPPSDSTSELTQLRTHLAELVRAGLPREVALKAVTLGAAKVLGMDDRFGSIEKGKEADLIFLDGDPLGTETRVTRVMIHGEIVWEAKQSP